MAVKNNLDNNFWPWGFRIVYRIDSTGTFTTNALNGINLDNKTLEQQLAAVLGIDLESELDSVINLYNSLWKFSLLNNNTFLIRFNFLD